MIAVLFVGGNQREASRSFRESYMSSTPNPDERWLRSWFTERWASSSWTEGYWMSYKP